MSAANAGITPVMEFVVGNSIGFDVIPNLLTRPFSQRANLNVVCGHIDDDSILWPDPEAEKLYRIESTRELILMKMEVAARKRERRKNLQNK